MNKHKVIFLIYDGGTTYWSNSDSDSLHTEKEDVTKYIRADVVEQQAKVVKELREALLEAMKYNWLDKDAPPRFEVDNLPDHIKYRAIAEGVK